jgi:hypothetical protein
MQGQIIREECEPYEYVNKESGEIIMLSHRYVYAQDEPQINRPQETFYENFKPNQDVFSKNGKLELEHA